MYQHAALLGPRSEHDKGKKCFVIDLDETLVHSSFKMVEQADFKVGVEIDGVTHRVYVLKRPHVDAFLSTMANLYECVLFTASLAKYADPVADFIDKWNAFRYRLFRESCVYHRGNYVKDLSHLGRPINQVVILDNSPASYMFHANHAVQISSWFDDTNDRALLDLIPYFERLASHPNVVDFLRTNSPPTSCAAVGTVGLPAAVLTSLPVADAAGRSTDSGAIISSIRRPAVASPLPVTVQESRLNHARRELPTPSTTSTSVAELRKQQPQSLIANQRLPGASTLPVITKVAASSGVSGVSVPAARRPIEQDAAATFPAPLSLATYVPVPTPPTAVVISNSTSSNSTQARVGDSETNAQSYLIPVPSPSSPPSHSPPPPANTTTNTVRSPTAAIGSPPKPFHPNQVLAERPLPPGVDRNTRAGEHPKRTFHKMASKPPYPLAGGNHHLGVDSAPRRLGTVKSLPEASSPIGTISPPLSVAPSPVSTRRISP